MSRFNADLAIDHPLVVKVYGDIGPNLCYSYKRVEVDETVTLFELTLFGVHGDRPGLECGQAISYLQGREFVKQPPHGRSVEVIVNQPGGTVLREQVQVSTLSKSIQ